MIALGAHAGIVIQALLLLASQYVSAARNAKQGFSRERLAKNPVARLANQEAKKQLLLGIKKTGSEEECYSYMRIEASLAEDGYGLALAQRAL